MNTPKLLYVGIKGSVIALDANTGQQVWATHLSGCSFVNLHISGGKVFASCYGEIFCMDAATGNSVWHNSLKGFGVGLATLATGFSGDGSAAAMFEKIHQDQQSAGVVAASSVAAT